MKDKRTWLIGGIGLLLACCILAVTGVAVYFLLGNDGALPEVSNPLRVDTPTPTRTRVPDLPTRTPTITPSPTPVGPPALSLENFQQFNTLYKWNVTGDVVRVNGIAVSHIAERVALLTEYYPPAWGLEVHDLEGNLVWKRPLDSKAVYPAIAFSPDGTMIATGTDDAVVRVWSTEDGSLIQSFQGHRFPIRIVVFSQDNRMVASGGSDNTARIWLIPNAMMLAQFDNKTDVRDLAFSYDNRYLAVSGNVVIILDAATGREVDRYYDTSGQTRDLGEVAFSPDGKWLAAMGDWYNVENGRWRKRILIWDFSGPHTPIRIPLDDAVEDVVFNSDGRIILGSYKDRGQLLIIHNGKREIIGYVNLGPKLLMSYSQDIRLFAVLATRTSVTIWGVEP